VEKELPAKSLAQQSRNRNSDISRKARKGRKGREKIDFQLCDLGVLGARNIRIRNSGLRKFARATQILNYSNAKKTMMGRGAIDRALLTSSDHIIAKTFTS
jgi:hypothetical protein